MATRRSLSARAPQYHGGNSNYGYLFGNAVCRDVQVVEGWATYCLSAGRTREASYRQSKGGGLFLEGGSTQSDAILYIPAIGPAHTNVSGWLQIAWERKLAPAH
jgi:hypothetical protein